MAIDVDPAHKKMADKLGKLSGDAPANHGHISKQGSVWLRWALNQAAQTAKRSPEFAPAYSSIAKRRGKKIATIAISRKLLTRAWLEGQRVDGVVRVTDRPAAPGST